MVRKESGDINPHPGRCLMLELESGGRRKRKLCKLLHAGTGKRSQASCLHCLAWPLFVNVRQQLPALSVLERVEA